MPAESKPLFTQWEAALREFFDAKASLAGLPLDLRGTAFQVAVWRFLQSVPAGKTVTYAEVAAAVGRPKAVRAVASACAHNRIALAVPCHRVIRGDGTLAGYRWGVERKFSLLNRERDASRGLD
jgi:AraC family transcriptional regulator of adaptative response/methylated-DNA-[protein]-cysteine methyltransferase